MANITQRSFFVAMYVFVYCINNWQTSGSCQKFSEKLFNDLANDIIPECRNEDK